MDTLKHGPRDKETEISSNLEVLVSYWHIFFAREGKWDAQPMYFFHFCQNIVLNGRGLLLEALPRLIFIIISIMNSRSGIVLPGANMLGQ